MNKKTIIHKHGFIVNDLVKFGKFTKKINTKKPSFHWVFVMSIRLKTRIIRSSAVSVFGTATDSYSSIIACLMIATIKIHQGILSIALLDGDDFANKNAVRADFFDVANFTIKTHQSIA